MKFKVIILAMLAILTAGCTLTSSTKSSGPRYDGGIWRSIDGGNIFSQTNDVLATKGKTATLSNININKLAFDPQSSNTVYAATAANGLFYSGDSGLSWQQFGLLNKGNIIDVAVSYQNKCVVYAVMDNKIYKTENCGRDITNIYYHQKPQVYLTTIAIDPNNPAIIYTGTTEGEILKSLDAGLTWTTIVREKNDRIMDIIIDPYESRILYVGTARNGILKSLDGGLNWESLGDGLKSYTGSHEYRQLIYLPATRNGLILVSKFGLLKTFDGGNNWQIVELLPSHKTTNILAIAVNPENSDEIYYATAVSLVKTIDGGLKWSSKQLPIKQRSVSGLFVDPSEPLKVYLTSKVLK